MRTFFLCRFAGSTLRRLGCVITALRRSIRILISIWKNSKNIIKIRSLYYALITYGMLWRLAVTRWTPKQIYIKKKRHCNTPWYQRFINSKLNILEQLCRYNVHYIGTLIASDKTVISHQLGPHCSLEKPVTLASN